MVPYSKHVDKIQNLHVGYNTWPHVITYTYTFNAADSSQFVADTQQYNVLEYVTKQGTFFNHLIVISDHTGG